MRAKQSNVNLNIKMYHLFINDCFITEGDDVEQLIDLVEAIKQSNIAVKDVQTVDIHTKEGLGVWYEDARTVKEFSA